MASFSKSQSHPCICPRAMYSRCGRMLSFRRAKVSSLHRATWMRTKRSPASTFQTISRATRSVRMTTISRPKADGCNRGTTVTSIRLWALVLTRRLTRTGRRSWERSGLRCKRASRLAQIACQATLAVTKNALWCNQPCRGCQRPRLCYVRLLTTRLPCTNGLLRPVSTRFGRTTTSAVQVRVLGNSLNARIPPAKTLNAISALLDLNDTLLIGIFQCIIFSIIHKPTV